jgi:hypothetical protein
LWVFATQRPLADPSRFFESFQRFTMVLSSKVRYANVVKSRRNIRVKLPVSTPLAFKYCLEERKRIQGIPSLQTNRTLSLRTREIES